MKQNKMSLSTQKNVSERAGSTVLSAKVAPLDLTVVINKGQIGTRRAKTVVLNPNIKSANQKGSLRLDLGKAMSGQARLMGSYKPLPARGLSSSVGVHTRGETYDSSGGHYASQFQ